jgi:DNA-binding HxlR family transcriptional regulator
MKGSHTPSPPPVIIDEACQAFQTAIAIVGRRWSAAILRALALGAERFGDILRRVDGMSDRLLSQRLKELETEGLITRTVVPTTPVQIRYGLTKRGHDLIVALQPLVDWGIAANAEHTPRRLPSGFNPVRMNSRTYIAGTAAPAALRAADIF